MDAQRVYSVLISDVEYESKYGYMVEDCRASLKSRSYVSCKWVRRNENTLVHSIIRSAFLYPNFHVWEDFLNNVELLF